MPVFHNETVSSTGIVLKRWGDDLFIYTDAPLRRGRKEEDPLYETEQRVLRGEPIAVVYNRGVVG